MEIGGKESIMTKRKREREIKLQENLYEDEDLNTKDIKNDINRIRYIPNNEKKFYEEKINSEFHEILRSNEYWQKINNEVIRDVLNSSKEFLFGNYDKYYYNRYLEAMKDPRLNLIKSEWFDNKECLHIGCNDGLITIMLSFFHQPKTLKGIDIDYKLVKKAIKNVKYVERDDKVRDIFKYKSVEIIKKMENMPKSFLLSLGFPNAKNLDMLEKLSNFKKENINLFPKNIFFTLENYVSKLVSESDYYKLDTIISFSTSKWIHLNYGDVGIKIFFYNIYKSLKPGGIFLFEFQNWKSYKKRKCLSENIKDNFLNIKLRPEFFKEYLENTYGFLIIDTLNLPSNNKKMFMRPIYVFRKRFDSE
jgi:7SK snRNA methylphosphate capping enzyme